MRTFTITAQRGSTGCWVLDVPEAGAVSQVDDLAAAGDEMREAVAYQTGLDPAEIEFAVQVVEEA